MFTVDVKQQWNGMDDPVALRKAKIVCNFVLSECSRVNVMILNVLQIKKKGIIGCQKSLKCRDYIECQ